MSFNSQSLDLAVGALLVGMTVTSSLFGILTAQTAYYYRHYPHDRHFLKAVVLSVWSLDALQQVFFMATIWGWLIQKKATDIDDHPLMRSANIQLVVNAVLVCFVQLFYSSRVWALSKNSIVLTGLCWGLIFATLALTFALFSKSVTIRDLGDLHTVSVGDDWLLLSRLTKLLITIDPGHWNRIELRVRRDGLVYNGDPMYPPGPFTDRIRRVGRRGIIITASLMPVLLACIPHRTSRLINKLLLFCLNTGLLTTVCAIIALAMLVSFPGTSLYVIFYFMGGRLYSISLLGTLNARADLRRQMEASGHLSDLATPPGLPIRRHPRDTFVTSPRVDLPSPPTLRSKASEDGLSSACEESPRDGKGKAASVPAFHTRA
ncbi:hypothetical protein BD414DRAFT_579724 [Trametes punicea]|nr:hypothetical protein BD414DRAFT_579724 [Trametes punicea]